MVEQILNDRKDFNFARLITHQELVPYIAPEMLTCKQLFIDRYHPKATDCWALGVILYFMIFYKLPFNDDNSKKVKWTFYRVRKTLVDLDGLVGSLPALFFKVKNVFSHEDQNKH